MQFARTYIFLIAPAVLFVGMLPSDANAQFISTNRKDHVFDPVNRILYISTPSGTVQRWHADTAAFLTPWTVAGDLGGIDVTPDGATVLVADRTFNTTTDRGLIHRINAADGAVTTLDFALDGGEPSFTETGSWDVVAMSNGKAFFTSDFVGSAWMPFHQLDLATNTITNRADALGSGFGGEVDERTWLFRNGNHSVFLALESNLSSGPFFSYSALTDSFLGDGETSTFHSDATGAVSRNGNWVAVEVGNDLRIYDATIGAVIQTLPGIDGGAIFHPSANYLFGLNAATDQVVVYRTGTWNVVTSFAVGGGLSPTNRFDTGVVSFDPATNALFVSVPRGIQRIATSIPEPSSALLLIVSLILSQPLLRSRNR